MRILVWRVCGAQVQAQPLAARERIHHEEKKIIKLKEVKELREFA